MGANLGPFRSDFRTFFIWHAKISWNLMWKVQDLFSFGHPDHIRAYKILTPQSEYVVWQRYFTYYYIVFLFFRPISHHSFKKNGPSGYFEAQTSILYRIYMQICQTELSHNWRENIVTVHSCSYLWKQPWCRSVRLDLQFG